jgi:hypothetical protein
VHRNPGAGKSGCCTTSYDLIEGPTVRRSDTLFDDTAAKDPKWCRVENTVEDYRRAEDCLDEDTEKEGDQHKKPWECGEVQ